jgi:hypothetical protein
MKIFLLKFNKFLISMILIKLYKHINKVMGEYFLNFDFIYFIQNINLQIWSSWHLKGNFKNTVKSEMFANKNKN